MSGHLARLALRATSPTTGLRPRPPGLFEQRPDAMSHEEERIPPDDGRPGPAPPDLASEGRPEHARPPSESPAAALPEDTSGWVEPRATGESVRRGAAPVRLHAETDRPVAAEAPTLRVSSRRAPSAAPGGPSPAPVTSAKLQRAVAAHDQTSMAEPEPQQLAPPLAPDSIDSRDSRIDRDRDRDRDLGADPSVRLPGHLPTSPAATAPATPIGRTEWPPSPAPSTPMVVPLPRLQPPAEPAPDAGSGITVTIGRIEVLPPAAAPTPAPPPRATTRRTTGAPDLADYLRSRGRS